MDKDTHSELRGARLVMIMVLSWTIYATLYLCRVNFSIVIPLMRVEMGISYERIGIIASGFFVLYAIGQVLNGYLTMSHNPCNMIVLGVMGSALVTMSLGLCSDFTSMLLLWSMNGYLQSVQWPSLIRVLSEITRTRLGTVLGIFNTSWAIGHVATWILTGFIVSNYGWRYGFIVNGLLLALTGGIAGLVLRSVVGRKDVEVMTKEEVNLIALGSLSLSYLLADATRYGMIVYLPSYVFSKEGSIEVASTVSTIIPLAGSLGMIAIGGLSDVFPKKRALFTSLITIATMTFVYLFPQAYEMDRIIGILTLALASFFLYGANSQIVSTIPVEMVNVRLSPMVSGVVNAMGGLGAFISSLISGAIIEWYGFETAFGLWSLFQLLQALLLIFVHKLLKKRAEP
ncbi:MAG: hypothetical protein DRN15_03775 [Thermoprotei archaeon]|nr:MAG: hypothetical protein DRM97_07965 [Thermoprotei archaeon]RLF24244.1 MAG: hypothetical protein DRN15_03775 [Thermoprotei archaeon]